MRRRTFKPERPFHEATRLPFQAGNTTGWSTNPRDHIAIFHPMCGIPACREPAMVWSRCRCGETFSRCHQHHHEQPVAVLRAAHRCP